MKYEHAHNDQYHIRLFKTIAQFNPCLFDRFAKLHLSYPVMQIPNDSIWCSQMCESMSTARIDRSRPSSKCTVRRYMIRMLHIRLEHECARRMRLKGIGCSNVFLCVSVCFCVFLCVSVRFCVFPWGLFSERLRAPCLLFLAHSCLQKCFRICQFQLSQVSTIFHPALSTSHITPRLLPKP